VLTVVLHREDCCLVAVVVVTVVVEILNKFTRLFVDIEVGHSFVIP
jgi:hypothetical protein